MIDAIVASLTAGAEVVILLMLILMSGLLISFVYVYSYMIMSAIQLAKNVFSSIVHLSCMVSGIDQGDC